MATVGVKSLSLSKNYSSNITVDGDYHKDD